MKILCVRCDEPMQIRENPVPDAGGSLSVVFRCGRCGQETAMLTNPGETQMVRALGVRIGPAATPPAPPAPLAHLRGGLAESRPEAVQAGGEGEPAWTAAALERLAAAPAFVQAMIRKSYADFARRRGLAEITPEVMDLARREMGMGE